jgi:hypothetical protein
MIDFNGRWITTFGPIDLRQDGATIRGTYYYQGVAFPIQGKLVGTRFVFRYQDATGTGEGWFELTRFGQFQGQYRLDGTEVWGPWSGQRAWDGIWETPFGRMRLMQEATRIHGAYGGPAPGTIDGRLDGNRLVFRYAEPNGQGDGWFDLAADASSFQGAWRPDGASMWGQWSGQRVMPFPGLTWLVVIEAYWQSSFADREYSYGQMLTSFFARLPHVAVRHRFFNDETSLERWCRELTYCPEPAIVLISSHGTEAGVSVHGQTINARLVVDSLREAPNIQLLHFAACLMLKEETAGEFTRKIGPLPPFPISGYTTSVDWGGSAVLEFGLLDMVLGKGLAPLDAAARLPKLITYSGARSPAESPYAAAGFRIVSK